MRLGGMTRPKNRFSAVSGPSRPTAGKPGRTLLHMHTVRCGSIVHEMNEGPHASRRGPNDRTSFDRNPWGAERRGRRADGNQHPCPDRARSHGAPMVPAISRIVPSWRNAASFQKPRLSEMATPTRNIESSEGKPTTACNGGFSTMLSVGKPPSPVGRIPHWFSVLTPSSCVTHRPQVSQRILSQSYGACDLSDACLRGGQINGS